MPFLLALQQIRRTFFFFKLIFLFSGRSQIELFRRYLPGMCWINCRFHFVGVGINEWSASSAFLKVTYGGGLNNFIKIVDTHLPWGFGVELNQIWIWHFTAHIKDFYKGTSEHCQLYSCSYCLLLCNWTGLVLILLMLWLHFCLDAQHSELLQAIVCFSWWKSIYLVPIIPQGLG